MNPNSDHPSSSLKADAKTSDESSRLIERAALRMMRPLVRWLIRQGVTFPQFSESLKHVFLDEARHELMARAPSKSSTPLEVKQPTDSALSLLSGVHRRDIRSFRAAEQAIVSAQLEQNADADSTSFRDSISSQPLISRGRFGLAAQVIARWFSDPRYLDENEQPFVLARTGEHSFDALVAGISTDVRPRAVLDQLITLGLVEIVDERVKLIGAGFAPRSDWSALSASASDNINDHLRAAIDNLDGKKNWLEQAIFADEMSAESVQKLHVAASAAWRANHRKLMQLAQQLYEHDQENREPFERSYRARIGMYYYDETTDPTTQTKE